MWVMMREAFVSIVEYRSNPTYLLVRARVKGDLERVFPAYKKDVKKTPGGDYPFRVAVYRKDVAAALAAEVEKIDYPNFKNSVPDRKRHDAYMDVWIDMRKLQAPKPKPKSKPETFKIHY